MESREEKTRAIIDAITQRSPGKRQIKLVSAVDFQLFEDLADDSDQEFKAKTNGDADDSSEDSESDDDVDNDEDKGDNDDDDENRVDENDVHDGSSSLKSNKSSDAENTIDEDESDTTEDTEDSDDDDSDELDSSDSNKDSTAGPKGKSKRSGGGSGGDLRALIDGVVAASSSGGKPRSEGAVDLDGDDQTSSDEDWLEGRMKRQQLKKQQKQAGKKKGKKGKKQDSDDSGDGSEAAMLKGIKPRKKSTRRVAAKASKKNEEGQNDDEDVRASETTVADLAAATAAAIKKVERLTCMVCLSNRSDPENELVECDACHVTVHEACYGLADSQSLCSTGSSASTEPWFCDACAAGVTSPSCQLCPVSGGVFKPTEDGRWVHLVCALYTPDVAFNDVDSLTDVTLTELKPRFWGAKECAHCSERNYAYTGVCVGCDAGLCKFCFHVTCAQREGLLSEPAAAAAAAEAVDEIADPFYAQCRQHTDPSVAKQRKKAYSAAFSRQRAVLKEAAKVAAQTPVGDRIARKLAKRRSICAAKLAVKQPYFIPQQKQPLFLELSPHAVRLFAKKAAIYGVGDAFNETGSLLVSGQERSAAQTGLPVFCPEFIQHFLDRENRIVAMNKQLAELAAQESELIDRQSAETLRYSEAESSYQSGQLRLATCRQAFISLWNALNAIGSKVDQNSQQIPPPQRLRNALEGVKTAGDSGAAADDAGDVEAGDEESGAAASSGPTKVGDLAAKAAALRRLNECCVCKAKKDQHLMVKPCL